MAERRVALLLQDFDQGGVERCFVNLACGLVGHGCAVELLTGTAADDPGCYLAGLDPRVELTRLPADPAALAAHLRHRRPAVLLAAKDADCALAGRAKRLAGPQAGWRLALCASVNPLAQLAGRNAGPLRRWRRRLTLRRLFAPADQVICVSGGVARDLAGIIGRPQAELQVLPNPIVTPELTRLAAAVPEHSWFSSAGPPVVLGAGRLNRMKNFPLLIDAFARLRARRDCRLVILGEGKHRDRLLAQADRLRVRDALDLPGFTANPYAYMARAALFALSSRWEGFGNVLVEALACATPVVSTDCPSGPGEILRGGEVGPLVAMDDPAALAAAMERTLTVPPPAERLRAAAAPYTVERSAGAYLDAFGLL